MSAIKKIRHLYFTMLLAGMLFVPAGTQAGNYSSPAVRTLIDSLIKEPAAPVTMAFTPDLMTSFPLANPTSKVEMIRPPEVNNRGSAELSYRFEMPPARNGMSPQLSIRYGSNTENEDKGRLGIGWDWDLSTITKEEENNALFYLLDGKMMYGGADNRYVPRHESDFKRIILNNKDAKGNDVPANERTWIVTDKQGTKYYYGWRGLDKNNKVVMTGVSLKNGAITEWKLRRIEEVHGDYIEYVYNKTTLLLDSIKAGNKDENAHTVVKFTYEAPNNYLKTIEVKFESDKNARLEDPNKYKPLRRYTFAYVNDTLKSLTHSYYKNGSGSASHFASHTFDYYNDARELEKLRKYIKRTGNTDLDSLDIDRTGKLKTVHNPLGGCFTINYNYAPIADTLVNGEIQEVLPPEEGEGEEDEEKVKIRGKLVMKSVRINDGVKDDGTDTKYTFTYAGGIHDKDEEAFYGYRDIEIREIDTENESVVYRRTFQTYDVNSYGTCGNLLNTLTTGSDMADKYREEQYEYFNYQVYLGNNNYTFAPNPNNIHGSTISFNPLKTVKTVLYEGTATMTSEKHYEYYLNGHYGQLRQLIYRTPGAGNGYRLSVDYASYNNADYIVALPGRVRVTGENDGITYRQVSAVYNTSTGEMTRIEDKLDNSRTAVTTIKYDEWGNIIEKTMPDNMKYTYLYDRDYNTYVERVADSHGYLTEMEKYDYRYGIPRITRDMNRYTLEQTINDLGRVDTVISPNEQESGKKFTILYEYSTLADRKITQSRKTDPYDCTEDYFEQADTVFLNVPDEISVEPFSDELARKVMGGTSLAECLKMWEYETDSIPVAYDTIRIENCFCTDNATPVYALTKRYDYGNVSGDNYNCIETACFVDGMGRVIQEQRDAAVTTSGLAYNHTEQEQKVVSGRTYYDAFGRAVKTCYPTTTAVSSRQFKQTGTFDGEPFVEMEYDRLDRVTKSILADGTEKNTSYGIADNRLASKTTFDNVTYYDGTHRVEEIRYTNAWGLTTQEEIGDETGRQTTVYHYNPVGQLTQINRGTGQVEYEYDMAGKPTKITAPVMSGNGMIPAETTLTYNNAGSLTQKRMPNGQTVNYRYDDGNLNRLIGIEYPQHPENNVTYTYGGKNASHNRVGRVMLQEDASGAQEFFYGRLGEVSKIRRTIVIPNQAIATYVTQWQRDSWNRLTEIIYPDGEKVTYSYNTGGLLSGMKAGKTYCYDYVSKIGYNKFDRRVYMKYGNGQATTDEYNAAQQLNRTVILDNAGHEIYSYWYAYDNRGNTIEFSNNAFYHHYYYNGYNDMKLGRGEYGHGNLDYEITYQYDPDIPSERIGKEQFIGWDYSQGPDGWGDRYIREIVGQYDAEYDPNGNLTGIVPYHATGEVPATVVGEHKFLWDSENRLSAIKDGYYTSHYLYDAQGNRVVKTGFGNESVFLNALPTSGNGGTGSDFTAYINPYMEVTKGGAYTKHFFIGNERVVSKPGDMESFGADPRRIEYAGHDIEERKDDVDYAGKYTKSMASIISHYSTFGMAYHGVTNNNYVNGGDFASGVTVPTNPEEELKGNVDTGKENPETERYYYFANKASSTMYLSNQAGNIVQVADYLPFGELIKDERLEDSWHTRYLYHGKEFDEETGFYYYDGRYYFPSFGIWLNASSPLDRNTVLTPYVFKNNNPETK